MEKLSNDQINKLKIILSGMCRYCYLAGQIKDKEKKTKKDRPTNLQLAENVEGIEMVYLRMNQVRCNLKKQCEDLGIPEDIFIEKWRLLRDEE